MGKLTSIAIGVMMTFFLVGMMATSMYQASNDETKRNFTLYQEYQNLSELNEQNLSYANTNNSVSNMQLAAETIANKIAEAQEDINSDDPISQVLGAFGLLSALTIDVLFLLLAILMDGVNFVAGVAFNITLLPTPWNEFGKLIGVVVGMFVVYTVFKIASAVVKVDL